MSRAFTEVRGAFYKYPVSVKSNSVIRVEGLDGFIKQNNVLVQDFRVAKREKQAIVQCFGETNHVYAFGADPTTSQFSVTLAVFLANCGGKVTGNDVGAAISIYEKLRVSQKKALVSMTIGGKVLKGTASGFESSVANQQLNMVQVTFMFTDFQTAKGGSGSGSGSGGKQITYSVSGSTSKLL